MRLSQAGFRVTNNMQKTPHRQLWAIREAIWNVPSCDEYHLVVLIEASFRPLLLRFLEYSWLLLLLTIKSPRASRVTIGLNQLRFDHWLGYMKFQNKSHTFSRVLRACENLQEARSATKWYLKSRGFTNNKSVSISRIYTGRRNSYYDHLFSESSRLLGKAT